MTSATPGNVTDKKGNFFEMIEYLPYGETLYDEAATVDKTEFRFTSKEMDAETGLYYHGARYRDAKTGVWLSVDPYLANGNYFPVPPVNDKAKERNKKLPAGGVFSSVNLNAYHYAGNNPICFVDPDGKVKMVFILIDQPGNGGDKDSYEVGIIDGVDVGHTFITVCDTDTGQILTVGFYPHNRREESISVVDGKIEVDGIVKLDQNHDWDVGQVFIVSDELYESLVKDIEKDICKPGKYNLNNRNCTSWVIEKLKNIGITLPNGEGKWPGGTGSCPGVFGEEIADSGGFRNPNSGSSSTGSSKTKIVESKANKKIN